MIPSNVKFDMGGDFPKLDMKIDDAAIKDAMEYDRKFWNEDARKIEQLPEEMIAAPLERAKARLAGSMASIFKPASEMLPLVMKTFPNAETC